MHTYSRLCIVAMAMSLISATAKAEEQADGGEEAAATSDDGKRVASNWLIGAGGAVFAVSYGLTVGVSLASDRSCEGSTCNERYLSLVPIVGGILQFAVAGKDFHDEHHTDACFPRTIAAVSGQVIGAGAFIAGLILRPSARPAAEKGPELSVSPQTYGGAGFGLSVGVRDF